MKDSNFFSWNKKDAIKGALFAGLAIILKGVWLSMSSDPPQLPTSSEFMEMLKFGGQAALAYLAKNLISNSDGMPLKRESKSSNT